jgi:hypothetical protein
MDWKKELKRSKEKADELFKELKNDLPITAVKDGSNIFSLKLPEGIQFPKSLRIIYMKQRTYYFPGPAMEKLKLW